MHEGRNVIGICTSDLDQRFHTKLVERVVKELVDKGYDVMIFGSDSDLYYHNDSDMADASVFGLMNYKRVDVAVLFSETIRNQSILQQMVNNITSAGVPVLSIGKELEQCYNVIYDTDTAFEKLVRHIVEYHNVREVNFISGSKGNELAEARLSIYKHVLDDNDILYEESRVGYGDFWFEPTRKVMAEFIQPTKVPPEAIICANDAMALEVCDYLREHDIKVPDEVMVAGIDGIDEGIKHTPGITTCVRDEVNDAKFIARLIEHLCQGQLIDDTTVLEYHMQLSQSCGCQKKHLFDSDALIARNTLRLEAYRSDVKRLYSMSEEFLGCRDDNEFWELVGKYMPDNSFICINSDRNISGKREMAEQLHGFTKNLQAMVKLEGRVVKCGGTLENVVPDIDQDAPGKPVLLLPIHFCEEIVGYMGVWCEIGGHVALDRMVHFLLSFDQSAGLKLSKYGDNGKKNVH